MAYGDNRSVVASDTFDASIDGNWSNGDGDWGPCTYNSGTVEGNGSVDVAIRRNSETYDDDQYSTIVVSTHENNDWLGACVRMQSGTDESCYVCYAGGYSSTLATRFIYEISNGVGFSELSSGGTFSATTGDEITAEVEGTTIRLGGTNGGSDQQLLSTTDATLTGGDPGASMYENPGPVGFTSWVGGNISVTLSIVVPVGTMTLAGLEPMAADPPVITDVNTTESWDDGDTGLVITGSKFVN